MATVDLADSADWERRMTAPLRRLALALLIVGLAWRCIRYLLAFPLWGDEVMLLVNYLTKGYADLFGPIDGSQIAPLLFHVAEVAAFDWLGGSEWAMRLPAFLACIASLALFWFMCRSVLPPLAHCLATGILAVSVWPATGGALCKPYSFDLFFSLALLLPATRWLYQPEGIRPLVALCLVAPLAMIGSYPAAFVGGAIVMVLGVEAIRRRDRASLVLIGLSGLLLIGAFAWHFLAVGARHLTSQVGDLTTHVCMDRYWDEAFPPANPVRLLGWLALIHTGQMAAYPIGVAKGGSIVTFSLCVIGLVWLWRNERRAVVGIVAATFALWFAAACLRKYPYGQSGRLSQHVAAFHCMLAGLGAAVLILRHTHEFSRWRTAACAASLLALIGVAGIGRDLWKPYREPSSLHLRQFARELTTRVDRDPIVALSSMNLLPGARWYLGARTAHTVSVQEIDWRRLDADHDSAWITGAGPANSQAAILASIVPGYCGRWICVEQYTHTVYSYEVRGLPPIEWHAFHLVRSKGEESGARVAALERPARPSTTDHRRSAP